MVLAGAVAEAIAPVISARGVEALKKNFIISATKAAARTDSQSVTITMDFPELLSVSARKNCPTLKAIKERAMSLIKSVPAIKADGIRSRKYGPINIPAIIYPLTSGSLIRFVTRVTEKPPNSESDSDSIVLEPKLIPSSKALVIFLKPPEKI